MADEKQVDVFDALKERLMPLSPSYELLVAIQERFQALESRVADLDNSVAYLRRQLEQKHE